MTWTDYLKSRRTLTEREVHDKEHEHDQEHGLIVPSRSHPEYGAAAH